MEEDNKGLEEVIAKFRAQREAQKSLANAAANIKVQAEINSLNAETSKTHVESDHKRVLTEESRARIEAKAKIAEANVNRINADAELLKSKAANLDEKTKNESDQVEIDLIKAKNERERIESVKENAEERKQREFASNMEKIRNSMEGPLDKILNSISASTNYDIRKKPVTTLVASAGLGLNALATQDRTPPIYGILAKLTAGLTTALSFYAGKGIGALFNKLTGNDKSKEASELIKLDPILKEVAATNKALAMEMAEMKIARFKQFTNDRFEREKSQSTFKTSNTSSTKESTVSIKDLKDYKPNQIIDLKLHTKLDSIIELVQTISNQYDSETDLERYNEEIKWRQNVIDSLQNFKNVNSKPEAKSGFSLLEFAGLAGIGGFVTSIIASVTKFLNPLVLLSKGLLPLAGPLALASTILLTLDWDKDLIKPLESIINTFNNGKLLEGLGKSLLLVPQIVLRFANRAVAYIAGMFGFDKVEKELNDYTDRLDLFSSIVKFKETILNKFDGLLTFIVETFNNTIGSISDIITTTFKSSIGLFKGFDISTSIIEFFDTLSDKLESLKFWKSNKEYKTDTYKNNQSTIIQKDNTSKLSNNTQSNSISKTTTNNIEKIRSESIDRLTRNTFELAKVKTSEEQKKLTQLVEKTTTSVISPITNTQINNNSNTSIASRPLPRITENTALQSIFNNKSGDFSGFLMG